MSNQAGTVAYVKVKNDQSGNFCLFGLVDNNGTTEHMFLWFTAGVELDTAADWILRNAQVALLRDAFVNKLPVVVFIDDVSSQVTSIQLGAMALGEPVV